MSYDDFWFIDTRVQTRNLRRYFIWFILLFAFVTIGSILAIKTMYHNISIIEIDSTTPTITVQEAKATNVNGYIKGELKNESENEVNGKNLFFALFDENLKLVGTEYIEIDTMAAGETKSYELKFKRDNVDSFFVTVVNANNE